MEEYGHIDVLTSLYCFGKYQWPQIQALRIKGGWFATTTTRNCVPLSLSPFTSSNDSPFKRTMWWESIWLETINIPSRVRKSLRAIDPQFRWSNGGALWFHASRAVVLLVLSYFVERRNQYLLPQIAPTCERIIGRRWVGSDNGITLPKHIIIDNGFWQDVQCRGNRFTYLHQLPSDTFLSGGIFFSCLSAF